MDNNTLEQQIAELKELLDFKNKQLMSYTSVPVCTPFPCYRSVVSYR